MIILHDISSICSLMHGLIIILFMFHPRYSMKKTLTVAISTMVPIIVLNFLLYLAVGITDYGMLMLFTLSLPTLIVFWFLEQYRDGRYFFCFFMVNTIVIEIMYLTTFINHFVSPETYLFKFIVRMTIFPIIEVFAFKKIRPLYLDAKKRLHKSWSIFALISLSFYLAMSLFAFYPTPITTQAEFLPFLTAFLVLVPVIYGLILIALRNQQRELLSKEQEAILRLQVSSLARRMDELVAVEERFRVERHNFRHKLKTIASLIKKEEYDECLKLLDEYDDAMEKTKLKRYCQHPVLDATLSVYLQRAERRGIKLDMGFDFPDAIPVDEAELAAAIANALENSINACKKLSEENRFIEIKVISRPRLMLRIVNSYDGEVEFDDDGIPVSRQEDHGIGVRFIAAFCQKNGGYYAFTADDKKFTLMLNF